MYRLLKQLKNKLSYVYGQNVYLSTRGNLENYIEIEFQQNQITKWKQKIQVKSKYHIPTVWEYEKCCFFGFGDKIEIRSKVDGNIIYSFIINEFFGFHDNYFIDIKKLENDKRNVSLYRIEDKIKIVKSISNDDKATYFNVGDNLYSTSRTAITSYNNKKWKHLYSSLLASPNASFQSQILSSDEKLYFIITGNDNAGLFVLDKDIGKVIKHFKGLTRPMFMDGDYIYTTKYKNILCRIIITTLKLEEWDCNNLITENGFLSIHDHNCAVINGKFCFTQSLGDYKAKLGVLDWERKELTFTYSFQASKGSIGGIQMNKENIFVYTQDDALHVFEKTE